MSKKVKIEFLDWDYTCADGCCTTYGTKILVDGKEIEHYASNENDFIPNDCVGDDPETAVLSVLKHLGYAIE